MGYLGEMVIFNNEDGEIKVQIDAVNETIWLSQKGMSELFGVGVSAVSKHLNNIYEDGELNRNSTVSKMEIVQPEGSRNIKREVEFYNLDAIIAVGYRVNSRRATQFRIWATKTLREYLVKGYLLDDNRFKTGQSLTYFKELIDRIRQIRTEEKVFYQYIRDIYKLSIDYDKDDTRTLEFFSTVQNKLLWAVSGKTASELVYYRSNHSLPMMGLTSTEKDGVVKSTDIGIGKNYLAKDELNNLKLIVEQYLSFAEAQAINRIPMRMKDWEDNLNIILTMNRKEILTNPGKVSKELAKKKVRSEYEEYKKQLKSESHLNSIKELDEDLKKISNKKTPKK
mgnify:CR=1 FL=1